MEAIDRVVDKVVPQLPKKWLSHAVGTMAHKEPPAWLNQKMIKAFASFYKIDTNEIEKPLKDYSSLGEFFARKLKDGARPIQGERVHPCDSRLIRSGVIHDNTLIQAKGKTFKLDEFIPDNPWSDDFDFGLFATYYLAPNNYHRVHAPVTGKICWVNVIPGELWPVNSWSVHKVDNLYAVNERVAVGIQTPKGPCIVVMVGATNVGAITMAFDSSIQTNKDAHSQVLFQSYADPFDVEVGGELGTFHLGSTAVVIYSPDFGLKPFKKRSVRLGEVAE